ncbi:MAG: DUF6445 family protein [Hyphomonas sp.]|nr:DUF6445 family protein [Hyphomonas sp.]
MFHVRWMLPAKGRDIRMTIALSPTIGRIGHEGEPIVVVDGFSSNPAALVEEAASRSFGQLGPHYPGIRAPQAGQYLSERMDLLQRLLADVFGLRNGANLLECNFSIVTTPTHALAPLQRLPHFDAAEPGRIAVLHYLCGPQDGGTGFFRHRASGFETVSPSRMEDYSSLLDAELDRYGVPGADYLRGDTALFEQTYRVDAAFNRLVIYRGWTLHSGLIPAGHALPADPRRGRLTINTFLQAQ